ncbi:MAG: Nif11-like leader peptide family natural product precursor [Rikenellaceae bacterium]
MSLQAAINFMNRIQTDDDFRRECYKCKSKSELLAHLSESGYKFEEYEMGNAVNHLIVRCKDEFEAEEIFQLNTWFTLFR